MKRRISAIQQIDGTLLGIVLSVIYLRRKVKKLRWEGDAREGGVENSKSGTKVQTILSAGFDAECPAAKPAPAPHQVGSSL
jgi:hypothetical protein